MKAAISKATYLLLVLCLCSASGQNCPDGWTRGVIPPTVPDDLPQDGIKCFKLVEESVDFQTASTECVAAPEGFQNGMLLRVMNLIQVPDADDFFRPYHVRIDGFQQEEQMMFIDSMSGMITESYYTSQGLTVPMDPNPVLQDGTFLERTLTYFDDDVSTNIFSRNEVSYACQVDAVNEVVPPGSRALAENECVDILSHEEFGSGDYMSSTLRRWSFSHGSGSVCTEFSATVANDAFGIPSFRDSPRCWSDLFFLRGGTSTGRVCGDVVPTTPIPNFTSMELTAFFYSNRDPMVGPGARLTICSTNCIPPNP